MKNLKRNIVIAMVLLFVCAAVYLNWSYNNKWGAADTDMVAAEDEATAAANEAYELEDASNIENEDTLETDSTSADDQVSDYFATARLTRQQAKDEALALLQTAASQEMASQEVIDSAMNEISVMATWTMQEAQLENLLLAKEFADCVVYIHDEGVTIAVPAPIDGLSDAAVARITDTVISETDYDATQLKIIEVRADTAAEAE